jgi:hypothetical protein
VRCGGAHGDDDRHRQVAQAANHECEDALCRRVEPLNVVHRQDDRPRVDESLEERDRCDGDGSNIRRRSLRLRHEQRDVKRVPLRRRQAQAPGEHRPKQVA